MKWDAHNEHKERASSCRERFTFVLGDTSKEKMGAGDAVLESRLWNTEGNSMSKEDRARYLHHSHRMQGGVEYLKDKSDQTPKMLRVGVNAAMSDQSGLAGLLIAKGIITLDEYERAMADAMEAEANRYEAEVQQQYPGQVGVRIGSLYPDKPE